MLVPGRDPVINEKLSQCPRLLCFHLSESKSNIDVQMPSVVRQSDLSIKLDARSSRVDILYGTGLEVHLRGPALKNDTGVEKGMSC